MIEKNKIVVILVICIVFIGGVIYYFKQSKDDYADFEEIENVEKINEVTEKGKEVIEESKIIVHIAGEVVNPGVIELSEGSRIIDAINVAGGVTEEADLSNINLAYILEDAQKIYVPNISELEKTETIVSSYIVENENKNTNEKIMVNINTANSQELQKIPGIGESTALKIINYRNENGKFNSIEDIQNVSGIGTSKFNKMKEYICIK